MPEESKVDGPATLYARHATSWTGLNWWRLESRAFTGETDVKHALAFHAPPQAWKELAKHGPSALGCVLMPGHVAALVTPILAALSMVGWLSGGVELAPLALTGALAGFAAVWFAAGMFFDRHAPDARLFNGGRLVAMLLLIPAAVATLIAVVALVSDAADWPWGILGPLAAMVVGVMLPRFYRDTGDDVSAIGAANLRRLDQALVSVSADRRRAIGDDVRSAVELLHDRGIIDEETARRARSAPFGNLGLRMAPRSNRPPDA